MAPKIIALSGKIGSGKTTVSDIIADLGPTYQIAFADILREISALLTGDKGFINASQDFKNQPCALDPCFSNGELLVKVGTALREYIFPEIFIRVVELLVARIDPCYKYVVISDTRFKNEVAAIKRLGGVVVRLNGDPAGVRAASKRDPKHQSECELDDYDGFDVVIDNSGARDLEALRLEIVSVLLTV